MRSSAIIVATVVLRPRLFAAWWAKYLSMVVNAGMLGWNLDSLRRSRQRCYDAEFVGSLCTRRI